MEITTIKRYYCPHCGYDQLNKKGFTPDGRQRFKCLGCNRTSTHNKRKRGSPIFNPKKLLPFMHLAFEKYTKEIYYSLGLLIADGSISKTNQMSITLHPNDEYILNYVREGLAITNKIKKVKCGSRGLLYSRLTWGYKHSYPYWEKVGMIHNKTNNEVWLPYMENFNFLRGYLDGDGCIYKNKLLFSCGSIKFLQDLQAWLSNYINNIGSLHKGHRCFTLSYSGKDMLVLCKLIYENSDNLRLERKYNKYLELISK